MFEDHDEDLNGSDRSSLPARSGLPLPAMTMVLLGLSALALVVVLAEVVWLRPRHDDVERRQEDRSQVLATTSKWALLVNTYTPATFDDVTGQVLELLTTKARTKYENEMSAAQQVLEAAKQSSKGTVLQQGVASLDDDSAVVLVVVDAERKNTQGTFVRHFRFQVELDKVGGEWLVDTFDPVTDAAQGASQ